MKRLILVVLLASAVACASLPAKQQAVGSLQASETALESAHDIERALCFNVPATEKGTHCTNPVATTIGLTDAKHQQMAVVFSDAFTVVITAGNALKLWQAGQPVPTSVLQYQADVNQILALAGALNVPAGAANYLAQAQSAVNLCALVLTSLGVK